MTGSFTHVTSIGACTNKFVYYHGLQERWNFILCREYTTNFIWYKIKINTDFIFTQLFNDSFYFAVNKKTDKKSHIYQHLSSNQSCFNCCIDDCFSILDYASTKYQLKIKEALYIKWLDPILNKQKKTLKITLCV